MGMVVSRGLYCIAVWLLFTPICAHAQNVVLKGAIVTPDRLIPNGWIVVKNGRIEVISTTRPAGADAVIDTGGIIFPGFVDLHNHPMYNAFERWTPGRVFKNRYEWRDLDAYKKLVGTPGGELQRKDEQTFCDLDEYSEIKAAIGGTTSITGISGRRGTAAPVPDCVAGLIRNLDWASGFYGSGIGHERIENALGVTPRDMKDAEAGRILGELADGKIDLLLVHVAEGSPNDMESALELLAMKGRSLLSNHAAIIHGAALVPEDFRTLRTAGVALIWSPRSNMELYGTTTNVLAAFREGVTIALAPDWSPTGSTNMLAELQYARGISREQFFSLLSERALFEMGTSIPARIAHIDDRVGSLQPGLYADLFVVNGEASLSMDALFAAKPQDVQLVLVGGVPLYGTEKLINQFKVTSEPLEVCGAKMLLNTAALTGGKFADVTDRLKADLKGYGLTLAPLAECRP
jgi:5-methylthioadenosine/S-adenosylhomocysteine deaminase